MQIGMITLTFQLTSSLFQPVIGYITDKRSMPWSLPVGMCFTLCGLILSRWPVASAWCCWPPRW